jgi:hypothetical protein
LWQPLLQELGVEARYVLALRHPSEVIASLNRVHRFSGAYGQLLWLRYVLEAEAATRGKSRAFAHYSDMLRCGQPVDYIDKIGREIGVAWPVSAEAAREPLEQFLSPDLWHERNEQIDRQDANWTTAVLSAFAAGDCAALYQACDQAAAQLAETRLRIDQVEQPVRKPRKWLARRRDSIRLFAARVAEQATEKLRR